MAVVVETNGIPFWGFRCTTRFRPILVVGLVDVHWGYDLDFDPWPYGLCPVVYSPTYTFHRAIQALVQESLVFRLLSIGGAPCCVSMCLAADHLSWMTGFERLTSP